MRATIPAMVLLGFVSVPMVGSAQSLADAARPAVKATPLIEIEGRGIRTTRFVIPFCGNSCGNLDPHFLSYRVAILSGGRVAGTLTENKLEDQAGSATSVFQGTATPAQMSQLRSLLLGASIGLVQGGCTAGVSEKVTDIPNTTYHDYALSYAVLWYGKANRLNFVTLPQGAGPCAPPLRNLIQHILSVARDVQARSSSTIQAQ